MTREEQRLMRGPEASLKKACKEIGRRRGWKTIAGRQYQIRCGVLYALYVSFPVFESGMLKANLRCRPPALDGMYREVFHMAEEAAEYSGGRSGLLRRPVGGARPFGEARP